MSIVKNASFRYTLEVEQACAGVPTKLVYLSSYSADRNPNKEIFVDVNAHVGKHWMLFEADLSSSSKSLLEWCVDEFGGTKASVHKKDHIKIEVLSEEYRNLRENIIMKCS